MSYLLGDNETASRRLGALADVFEPSTRGFLLSARRHLSGPVEGLGAAAGERVPSAGLALDLGCGPGHTTRLIAQTLGCASTVGIDSSTKFIERAARIAATAAGAAATSFLVHDVSSVPFPIGPADLIYSRYLLMHLSNPLECLRGWASQLRGGGIQLLEELEEIQTANALFRHYLNLMQAALADQEKELFIGRTISAAPLTTGMEIISNEVTEVTVPAADAAQLFFLNLHTLRQRPFVAENYSAAVLDDLTTGLQELAAGGRAAAETPPAAWSLRQMIFRRTAG